MNRIVISFILLLSLATVAVAGRILVPTPPGGGDGVNLYPEDQTNPLPLPAPRYTLPQPLDGPVMPTAGARGNIGGDDVFVFTADHVYDIEFAAASDGTLFALIWWDVEPTEHLRFTVMRSTDGGTTWHEWALFLDSTPGYRLWDPQIAVAEGAVDRVFVAYTVDPDEGFPTQLVVDWSPLDVETGDFSHATTLHDGIRVHSPSLTTDHESYSDYYVYLVWSADDDADGADVFFARSANQGTAWEPAYALANIAVSDRGYYQPEISIGYDGYVHVVWFLGFDQDHEYDDCLRYRRAPSWAGGGLASWEPMASLSSHLNEIDERAPAIDASLISDHVLIACERLVNTEDEHYSDGLETRSSDDKGESWTGPTHFGAGYDQLGDVIYQESQSRWLLSLDDVSDWGFRFAPVSSPGSWSEMQKFNDTAYLSGEPEIVIDPSHDDRIGILGGRYVDPGYEAIFDAEWRTDTGYPVTEPGFPVDLAATPISDPGLADVDGDGDREIVFGDEAGFIQVYRDNGSPLPGWPVDTGHELSTSPIAVGDLNGDGVMEIAAGTTAGLILVYEADGSLLSGFPYDTGYTAPAYVIIGPIGGPYPGAVVWGCDRRISAIDHHGAPYPGVVPKTFSSLTIDHDPAIGDVDGDGRADFVLGVDNYVYAFPITWAGQILGTSFTGEVSAPVALGDLDLDGDVEIVVPTSTGHLRVYDDDGAFPGWPIEVADSPLTGVAVASCLGGSEPEIAVSALNWLVSVYWADGNLASGWPVNPDYWYVYGKPVIGEVEGSNDILIGARGQKGWSWSNFGAVNDGWPKVFADNIYLAPAYGDVDLDGSAEVAFLTNAQLVLVDVHNPPSTDYRLWAMSGHDAGRTGCANCSLDLVPVSDDADRITRVSMAAPHPNPIASQTRFAFAVPVRARVELSIYDVRGRRVATVSRQEVPAGRHLIEWHALDDDGRPVASGQYVAALEVRGPGVDEKIARKVTILR